MPLPRRLLCLRFHPPNHPISAIPHRLINHKTRPIPKLHPHNLPTNAQHNPPLPQRPSRSQDTA
ncbi:hypothetical protein L873DRAFT_597610 [Choiromyces venosus 120613-1]|uniref:Uncharacterized protein n=1 Tax=Choiromyces venosus 120613-1 TaxID=1336337 RepID=A0A3N4K007_9PEZI|nr:hypothetical protein L873DRAFT_597610 [Choiromyces venosus 120613-1]